jgi:uncharacterized protein YjiS (DUF1127 family)
MNGHPVLASDRHSEVHARQHRLPALLQTLVIWRERRRYRRELEEKWKTAPHLIDDMGLTKPQVETEIVRPFWRA